MNPAAFGFTNVTDRCFFIATNTLCADPDTFLFFDNEHPTARAAAILGDFFVTAVPEPSGIPLVLIGLASLVAMRRRC